MHVCTGCAQPLAADARFCPKCGAAVAAPPPAAPVAAPDPVAPAAPAPVPAAAPAPVIPGRPHSPLVAATVALLPGAGQTYNGEPFKALAFLLFSPLVLPWIWSIFDAHKVACRIQSEGGRYGRGGFIWIFLQLWLVFNVTLTVLIVLTLAGVLK